MKRRRLTLGARVRDTDSGMARRRAGGVPWARLGRMGFALAVLGAVGWGVVWATTTPTFAVTEVKTGPYRYSDTTAVAASLRPALGRNIWRLDVGELSRELEATPWIREARLTKRWPRSLDVQIHEWRPVLIMAAGAEAPPTLLVEDGRVLERPADLPPLDLPEFVTAVEAGDSGSVLEDLNRLMAAIAMVGLEKYLSLDYIILDERGFSFLMEGGTTRLVVGDRDFADRLERYLMVTDDLDPSAVIDLRFDGKISLSDHDPGLRPTATEGAASWSADN